MKLSITNYSYMCFLTRKTQNLFSMHIDAKDLNKGQSHEYLFLTHKCLGHLPSFCLKDSLETQIPFSFLLSLQPQPWACSGFRRGLPPVSSAMAKQLSVWTPRDQWNHQYQLLSADPETVQRWADHLETCDCPFPGLVPENASVHERAGMWALVRENVLPSLECLRR